MILATGKARVQGTEYFDRPGVTYPSKAVLGFNPRLQPSGSGFGHSGSVVFGKDLDPLAALGFLGSRPVEYLLSLFIGELQGKAGVHPNHYEVGSIQRLPWPGVQAEHATTLKEYAADAVRAVVKMQRMEEATRAFCSVVLNSTWDLRTNAEAAKEIERDALLKICSARAKCDEVVLNAYGFDENDRAELDLTFTNRTPPAQGRWRIYFGEQGSDITDSEYAAAVLSWAFGTAIGRWRSDSWKPAILEQPDDKLALAPATNSPALNVADPEGGSIGVLVDDPTHDADVPARVRQVLYHVWRSDAEAIEQEACELVDARSIREYFRNPASFFADHLQRYSKSRRQAPLYWPLAAKSGSYTLWVYYHELNDQTLFKLVNTYVKPKIESFQADVEKLQAELGHVSGREASRRRDSLELLRTAIEELREFQGDLLRVADLPYKPNLNDGVLITAAPLWKLFRLSKWRNELHQCWKELDRGEYDWSHMAMNIWPDRVREKCKTDRSLAIAHDLEELYQTPMKASRTGAQGKRKTPAPRI